jgi:hypothetical protein
MAAVTRRFGALGDMGAGAGGRGAVPDHVKGDARERQEVARMARLGH